MTNPFQQQMVKLYIPHHMAPAIGIGGFTLEAGADRSVEVPKALADAARSHGLVDDPVGKSVETDTSSAALAAAAKASKAAYDARLARRKPVFGSGKK